MHPTKDIFYQRCTIDAAHQNYNTPNMHQRCITPKIQCTKDAPKMQRNKYTPHQRCIAPKNVLPSYIKFFFTIMCLIPKRHIFLCCIIDSLWAASRTQNWAKCHQVLTPKRHLFVVTTLHCSPKDPNNPKCPKYTTQSFC